MIAQTFLIAVLFVLIALRSRNAGAALGMVILSGLIWPEFLRVPLGIIQMSVPRLVAIALFFQFLGQGRARHMGSSPVDGVVLTLWIWTVVASVLAGAEFSQTSQMIGRGLDTTLMYFVARMALLKPEDYRGLFRVLAIAAFAMCVAGVYEAATWRSPYHRFSNVAARIDGFSEIRFGFLRAQGSTSNSIYFGLAMTIVTGLAWSLRGFARGRRSVAIVCLLSSIAALASLSSGPWLGMASLGLFNLYYVRPKWIKTTLWGLLFLAVLVEVASNRHFYHLIDYLALEPRTAWYRTRLLEIAVSQWQDYWIVGVGSDWPHHWAQLLDGRQHIDVVNNFVLIALYAGIPGLALFIYSHVLAIRQAVFTFQSTDFIPGKALVFGLAATLLAIDFTGMSVSLFGPALLFSNIVLGSLVTSGVITQGRHRLNRS